MADEVKAVHPDELLQAYAASIKRYYEVERQFVEDPSAETLWLYHVTLQRLVVLRGEVRRGTMVGDAVAGPTTAELQFEADQRHRFEEQRRSFDPPNDPPPNED